MWDRLVENGGGGRGRGECHFNVGVSVVGKWVGWRGRWYFVGFLADVAYNADGEVGVVISGWRPFRKFGGSHEDGAPRASSSWAEPAIHEVTLSASSSANLTGLDARFFAG